LQELGDPVIFDYANITIEVARCRTTNQGEIADAS